jgi:hypothetical protein
MSKMLTVLGGLAAFGFGEFALFSSGGHLRLSSFARNVRDPERSDPARVRTLLAEARAKRERRNLRRLREAAFGGWRR